MTTNLVEFLAVAGLVTMSTTFIIGFRFAIYVFDRRGQEEIRRRQPEWEAIQARISRQSGDEYIN